MKKILLLLICSLMLTGCESTRNFFGFGKKDSNPSTETIVVESMDLPAKSKRLFASSNVIKKESKSPIVIAETGKIDAVADELVVDQEKYDKLLKQIGVLEDAVKQRDEAIVALQSKSNEELQDILAWGLRIGGLLVVFGIIATVFGSKIPMLDGMGFMILSAGICTLVVSYTLMTKMMYLVPIGMIIVVALIGFTIWRALKHHGVLNEKDQIAIDLVKTVEYVKDHEWNPDKISKLQSPETQSKVKEIKSNKINNIVA